MKPALIIIFLFSISLFGQQKDSTLTGINFSPDSLNAVNDSTVFMDSLQTIVKRDSIVPLNFSALSNNSNLLFRNDLLMSDYRYTGDYLNLFSLNFEKDYGFIGQPNETFLYGVGNGAVGFYQDGILLNENLSNSLDLNLIQSEDIDSIEIIHLPRGFLYGTYNNAVAVNFITRDFVPKQPYSRIRYYEGPDGEALFDGTFNAHVFRKVNFSFNVTNRKSEETYVNNAFSIWQFKGKIKYLFNNSFNLMATYNYNDYRAGIDGGVDVDSISSVTSDVNSVLYDFILAPVIYPNGERKVLTHFPKLSIMFNQEKLLKSDLSLYYQFERREQKTFYNEYLENKVYGINFRNDLNINLLNLKLLADYRSIKEYYKYTVTDTSISTSINDQTLSDFSASAIVSANLLNEKFIPSVFVKYSNIGERTKYFNNGISEGQHIGVGFDLDYKLLNNLSLYFGFSSVKESSEGNFNSPMVETSLKYKDNIFDIDLIYFMNPYSIENYTGGVFFQKYVFGDLSGVGLNFKILYSKILLESSSSYYKSNNNELLGVPEYRTRTGIYFYGRLFSDNLNLKSGFVFTYNKNLNSFTYEHRIVPIASTSKLDFTLAGEIQKVFIAYFTWENLLGEEYYITPYYPMPQRNIRFGLAWELFN